MSVTTGHTGYIKTHHGADSEIPVSSGNAYEWLDLATAVKTALGSNPLLHNTETTNPVQGDPASATSANTHGLPTANYFASTEASNMLDIVHLAHSLMVQSCGFTVTTSDFFSVISLDNVDIAVVLSNRLVLRNSGSSTASNSVDLFSLNGGVRVAANAATANGVVALSSAGTGSSAISLTSTAGGITATADTPILITGNEDVAAVAVTIVGTTKGVTVTAGGTGTMAITKTGTSGQLLIQDTSSNGSATAVLMQSVNGGVTIQSGVASGNSVTINNLVANGTVVITPGSGGLDVDTTGDIDLTTTAGNINLIASVLNAVTTIDSHDINLVPDSSTGELQVNGSAGSDGDYIMSRGSGLPPIFGVNSGYTTSSGTSTANEGTGSSSVTITATQGNMTGLRPSKDYLLMTNVNVIIRIDMTGTEGGNTSLVTAYAIKWSSGTAQEDRTGTNHEIVAGKYGPVVNPNVLVVPTSNVTLHRVITTDGSGNLNIPNVDLDLNYTNVTTGLTTVAFGFTFDMGHMAMMTQA